MKIIEFLYNYVVLHGQAVMIGYVIGLFVGGLVTAKLGEK